MTNPPDTTRNEGRPSPLVLVPSAQKPGMTVERYIRLIAGTFILLSLALSQVHSPYWLLFTAFVGLNLFQSALSGWCLMEDLLQGLGVGKQPARM